MGSHSFLQGIFPSQGSNLGLLHFKQILYRLITKKAHNVSAVLCWVTQSCLTLCEPIDCSPPDSSVHGDSSGKNTGVGCHALLQGIFPMQESNPGLPHCRQILSCLTHQGSPRILEWVAIPTPGPNPGLKPGSPALQADSLPAELPEKLCISYIIC